MVNKDIVDYVKTQFKKGQSKEKIKDALVSAGWKIADIEEAFKYAESSVPLAPVFNNTQNSYRPGQASQNTQFLASPTDLLKEAWGIFKLRFPTFANIIIISALGSGILIAMMVAAIMGSGILNLFAKSTGNNPSDLSLFSNLGVLVAFLLFFLTIVVLQVWSQAAMLFAIKDSEENIGVKESYYRGWKKIGSIFWVGLLSGIIVVGGYLLFLIPGIIFGIWFSLATYIVIAEGTGGMNAILKSKEYVAGYWWEVLWRFIFIGLVIFGINIVVMLLGLIIPVLPNLLMIFVTPLTVIYSFLVYKNIKAIKEAKGEVKSEFSSGEKIKFIVVGILGVLVGLAMLVLMLLSFSFASSVLSSISPSFVKSQNRTMDARRLSEYMSLQVPLMMYSYDHNNNFPLSLDELVPKYTNNIPVDPITNLPYEYRQLNNGKNYELCANLSAGKKCVDNTF